MNGFSYSAEQIRALGQRLISHLTKTLENTKERSDWSDMMFDTLRAFRVPDVNLVCYPSARDEEEKRPEFLLDFIAYVQGKGILIAAESEWENGNLGLRHDFEKFLYVRAPIKLFLCRIDGAKTRAEELINGLYVYMSNAVLNSHLESYISCTALSGRARTAYAVMSFTKYRLQGSHPTEYSLTPASNV